MPSQICEICKQGAATIHATAVVGAKLWTLDCCESCAQKREIKKYGYSLSELLSELGATTSTLD